jgi:hypothetical protein
METNPLVTEEEEEQIDLAPTEEIIKKLPDNSRGYLIPTLDKVQNIYRFLPDPAMEVLMEFFNVSRANLGLLNLVNTLLNYAMEQLVSLREHPLLMKKFTINTI